MRQIRPYLTAKGARRALDNGGRFYNLLTKAGNDVIDPAELARAAGIHSSDARAFLYLEMSLMDLSTEQKGEVLSLLSSDLNRQFEVKRSRILRPSEVESAGISGVSAIVSGYPSFVEDRTQFKGCIVMVAPVIMVIPIMDRYDIYEVYDTPEMVEPRTVVAAVRGSKRQDGGYARFGGILKELHFEDKTGKDHGLYLETMYYTPLTLQDISR